MKTYLYNKIVVPILDQLQRGLTPRALSLSLAFGITGGLFPIPGTTSFVCLLWIYLFQLNVVATQVANLLMTPLNLVLTIPFIRMGDYLLGPSLHFSVEELSTRVTEDLFGFLADFWVALLHGIVAWLIFTVIFTYLIHIILYPVIVKLLKAFFPKDNV